MPANQAESCIATAPAFWACKTSGRLWPTLLPNAVNRLQLLMHILFWEVTALFCVSWSNLQSWRHELSSIQQSQISKEVVCASSLKGFPVIGHTLPQVASHCFSLETARKTIALRIRTLGHKRVLFKDMPIGWQHWILRQQACDILYILQNEESSCSAPPAACHQWHTVVPITNGSSPTHGASSRTQLRRKTGSILLRCFSRFLGKCSLKRCQAMLSAKTARNCQNILLAVH